jgi:hypothetical protein
VGAATGRRRAKGARQHTLLVNPFDQLGPRSNANEGANPWRKVRGGTYLLGRPLETGGFCGSTCAAEQRETFTS